MLGAGDRGRPGYVGAATGHAVGVDRVVDWGAHDQLAVERDREVLLELVIERAEVLATMRDLPTHVSERSCAGCVETELHIWPAGRIGRLLRVGDIRAAQRDVVSQDEETRRRA